MVRQAFADLEARHRMLEGFLLRLGRHEDADAFALRGGMLVRAWVPSAGRPARDVDLVCRLPYDVEDLRERARRVLADPIGDGVVFDAARLRLDPIRPGSRHPGVRLFAAGQADGWSAEISVDFTFGLDVWPEAERAPFATGRGHVPLWVCRPEMLIGRKVQVLAEGGRSSWRPKDLADIWWMLRRFEPSAGVVGEAIERSFVGHAELVRVPELLRHPSWWREHFAMARWGRFSRRVPGLPNALEPVVDEVRARLRPMTRDR